MTTTYRTMDASDLGDNATDADLGAFRDACVQRQAETGESDEAVTAWMWGGGDWATRVEEYVAPGS